MDRFHTRARWLARSVRRRFAEWEGTFGLDPIDEFFAGWKEMPEFAAAKRSDPASLSLSDAWWLAELCRTAYTPDRKEREQRRFAGLARREDFLAERSPFEEVYSLHKTANHVSLYRIRASGEGTIVCFRGTKRTRQWMMNLLVRPHGWRRFRRESDPDGAFLHSGFYVLFKRMRPMLFEALADLPRPWIFTGHSLGGALATIASVVAEGDSLCTFGSPKIANSAFHHVAGQIPTWRFVNGDDIVPRLPLPEGTPTDRVFSHPCPALRLTDSGLATFADPSDEDRLPFDPKTLTAQLTTPPAWFRDHRMGGYCKRLRVASSGSVG